MSRKDNLFGMPDKIVNTYHNKTILISGGLGYIGSALARSLFNLDCKIILLDQLSDTSWIPAQTTARILVIHGDISIPKIWESVLQGVDYLFHLAALEYDRLHYNIIRDLQVNALSVIHLLEVCRENNWRPRIIFSSSANLFGSVNSIPVNEKEHSNPLTLWSVHKLIAENYFQVYAKKYNIESIILRLTNVYGPTANQNAAINVVINKMITNAIAGNPLLLYSNRKCIRDYIFLEDVVRAFLYAGAEDRLSRDGSFYIIGSEEGRSIEEVWKLIANKVEKYAGKNIPIKYDDTEEIEPFEMRNFIADTTKFCRTCGWKPKILLEKGIELTIGALASIKIEKDTSSFGEVIKLNLGCAGRPLAGYINIDLDSLEEIKRRYPEQNFPEGIKIYQYDIFNLPFADGMVDEIRADSLLEHLSFLEEPKLFYEVKRVLRPGGIFIFSVPDFEDTVKLWLAAKDEWKDFFRNDPEAIAKQHWFGQYSYSTESRWGYLTASIYGPQNSEGQFHKNCYTTSKIREILHHLNFEILEISNYRWKNDRNLMILVKAKKTQ